MDLWAAVVVTPSEAIVHDPSRVDEAERTGLLDIIPHRISKLAILKQCSTLHLPIQSCTSSRLLFFDGEAASGSVLPNV